MPRLFTAIEVPEAARTRLSMMRGGLPGARWVEPEHYHLTLRFAGDISDAEADRFADALDQVWAEPFPLHILGLGQFGGDKPRSLWAGIAASEPLERLAAAHERAARIAGLPPEPRKFTPHITLARLSGIRPAALAQYLTACGGYDIAPFVVERFVLLSSRPGVGGGPYGLEAAYPLGGEDDDAGWDEA